MKKAIIVIIVLILISIIAYFIIAKTSKKEVAVTETTMEITSSAFQEGGAIPAKYSCKGENISPDLKIEGIPAEAKSLALIIDDPDAPAGLWTHFLLANIDPSTSTISEDSIPEGAIIGANSSGEAKYDGPCPPSGTHRYYFKIFALDRTLELKSGFSRRELEEAMERHILAQGQLIGKFSK
ncbi:MAG: YbhB/YbcL family Raf kinase inhibitor-like protein [Candidatus Berkelbacteria bacterium]|nr:YbhB/YbcL family Raf kinase inhibitor-like protein [Candidatus Berkelbacteria bacterium]